MDGSSNPIPFDLYNLINSTETMVASDNTELMTDNNNNSGQFCVNTGNVASVQHSLTLPQQLSEPTFSQHPHQDTFISGM